MTFVTYIVLDPRKPGKFQSPFCSVLFEPVYVGKGTHSRADRVLEIFKSEKAKKHAGIMFHRWLMGMKNLGLTSVPIIKIEQLTEEEAFISEKVLTNHWGLKMNGGLLFNSREGGEGGWSLSQHTRELLSLANQGENNPNWGKTWSEERKQKWKETWSSKERRRSKESMENAWAAMRRRYEIVDPYGKREITTDLSKFCANKNLPLTAFRKALKSSNNIQSGRAKGWSVFYLD